MRVGVVCEGATDFVAIDAFFGQSLADHGIEAEFVPIQPEKDKTSPEGGWGNVLHWLQKNGNYMRKCASGGQSLANAERGVGMSGYGWICRQDRGLNRLRPHWDQGRVLHFGLETGCDYTTIVRW